MYFQLKPGSNYSFLDPVFLGGKKIIKLSLLDSMGAITGGMTSTPALGTLIKSAGTNDVASSYASTYPIALICVVLGAHLYLYSEAR